MDQDELLANIREHLYAKPNKKSWLAIKQLFLDWSEDELPEIVANYIHTTVTEGAWSKYFQARGYTTQEELKVAPHIERTIIEKIDNLEVALEKQVEDEKDSIIASYGITEGPKAISHFTIDKDALTKQFKMAEISGLRKALLRPHNNRTWVSMNIEKWLSVTLNDGTVHVGDKCSCWINREVRDETLHVTVHIEAGELPSWAEHHFHPEWHEAYYYDEYYEDDWE